VYTHSTQLLLILGNSACYKMDFINLYYDLSCELIVFMCDNWVCYICIRSVFE